MDKKFCDVCKKDNAKPFVLDERITFKRSKYIDLCDECEKEFIEVCRNFLNIKMFYSGSTVNKKSESTKVLGLPLYEIIKNPEHKFYKIFTPKNVCKKIIS
jgi:hypothetical protein